MFRNLLADLVIVVLAIAEMYLVGELTEYYECIHPNESKIYAFGFLCLSALIIFGGTSYLVSKFIRNIK